MSHRQEQAEEEEAKQQKEETAKVATDGTTPSTTTSTTPAQSTIHHEAHVEPPVVSPTGTTNAAPTSASATTTGTSDPSPSVAGEKPSVPAGTTPPPSSSSSTHAHSHKSHLAGKPPKQTPEQKQRSYEEERKSYLEKRKRIETLSQKLIDRIRPFVEATKPGAEDDTETKKWGERIREEVLDLSLESFGIELCHLIGEIYMQKVSTLSPSGPHEMELFTDN